MASKSHIEWTEITWNPVTGCSKVSQGCKHCYAERMAKRLEAMGNKRYLNGFQLTLHEDLVEKPLSWVKPRIVFVNSMSDLFHSDVPLSFIQDVFETMNKCPQHIFQILTKRSKRLVEVSSKLNWSSNIWMGVSVENRDVTFRISDLQKISAQVKFLSCEPLLGSLRDVNLHGIDWVIAGGESGPGARPMESQWVQEVLQICKRQNVPFFFKQWGGVRKDLTGRILNNRLYNELPAVAYQHPYARQLFNLE